MTHAYTKQALQVKMDNQLKTCDRTNSEKVDGVSSLKITKEEVVSVFPSLQHDPSLYSLGSGGHLSRSLFGGRAFSFFYNPIPRLFLGLLKLVIVWIVDWSKNRFLFKGRHTATWSPVLCIVCDGWTLDENPIN